MDLQDNKTIIRISCRLMVVGLIVFLIGFTMNKFTFSGFERENAQWYQIMVWD